MTRDEILQLLRVTRAALDDDQIATRLGINRHYVNQVSRSLAHQGLTTRYEGRDGKLVNQWTGTAPSALDSDVVYAARRRSRTRRQDRARSNVDALIGDFGRFVRRFESTRSFGGPSLYFHDRALDQRQRHASAQELMADHAFFEYVYAVLPSWGMHRMGRQAAKVGEFDDMVESFRGATAAIEELWSLDIRHVPANDVEDVAEAVWAVLSSLRVSTSATRIVAGSKALHHVLPNLVPPIDRQYTFQFFTGQKAVTTGDERAFLEWFPYFAEIGRVARAEIDSALLRRGFMATGPAKVIDNAIVGFMQRDDGDVDAGEM